MIIDVVGHVGGRQIQARGARLSDHTAHRIHASGIIWNRRGARLSDHAAHRMHASGIVWNRRGAPLSDHAAHRMYASVDDRKQAGRSVDGMAAMA